MRFELSDDQRMLGDSVGQVLADLQPTSRVREYLGQGRDPRLWKQAVDQGWTAMLRSGEDGLDLGYVEAAVLAEQLGRSVAVIPALSTILAGDVLSGSDVESALSPEDVAAIVWGDDYTLHAPIADVALVIEPDEVRLCEVTEPCAAVPAMDQTRLLGRFAPGDLATIARIGEGKLAQQILDRAAVLYSAEMLGCADKALEMATEYAKERVQFGQPIGAFQAVKHRLADMLVDVEGMRSAVYYAAWAVDTDAPDASLAASVAKSWCSDASRRVLDSALQVHAGIGFTWEHDLHLYLKRAHLDQRIFGTAKFHRERIASALADRASSGLPLWG